MSGAIYWRDYFHLLDFSCLLIKPRLKKVVTRATQPRQSRPIRFLAELRHVQQQRNHRPNHSYGGRGDRSVCSSESSDDGFLTTCQATNTKLKKSNTKDDGCEDLLRWLIQADLDRLCLGGVYSSSSLMPNASLKSSKGSR